MTEAKEKTWKYSGLGPNEAFKRMAPALEGLGYCTLVVILLVMVYYMVIVAWTLFYTFLSFLPKLSWAYCDNDFNTNHCYSGLQEIQCQTDDPETIFYNKSCISARHVCRSFDFEDGNITHCFKADKVELLRNLYTRILSSEEYFNDYVLGIRGATWEHFGGVRWELLGCLTLAWIICFLCLMRGVQSIGKIVYFTALFPYAMLIALLIRGVTLEGALDGSLWFIMPKWSTLQSTSVWADAASQVFYSLGIGCGSLITLSSYSNFNNNCHSHVDFRRFRHLLDHGIPRPSNGGFGRGGDTEWSRACIHRVSGSGGADAVAQRVGRPVLRHAVHPGYREPSVQAINTAILDLRPDLRKRESLVVLGICVTCWFLAIPMVFDGGIYLFTLMDWNTASWAILLIGIAEVGVVGWCYGCNKFLRNIAEMQMRFNLLLRRYWWLSWVVLAPITCLVVFVYQIYTYEMPRYGKYIFPNWANAIGILIGLSTLAPMPLFFIRRVWKGPRDRSMFRPKKTWGPAVEKSKDTVSTASVKVSEPRGNETQENSPV
ncbi:sodium- and chloride-dependent glycine transporter 2-like isoform X7 [Apis cerana]|uniref:sodium- and chloride-dependent glycine transporter 2-like isoform X7 n=1 Tax=Apis cerana TaxID=7461 RepID=UPI002B224AD7|nr:sodium- and chloride-dependent glycine transporter 2-like isoform X7 [Apis cerana]